MMRLIPYAGKEAAPRGVAPDGLLNAIREGWRRAMTIDEIAYWYGCTPNWVKANILAWLGGSGK